MIKKIIILFIFYLITINLYSQTRTSNNKSQKYFEKAYYYYQIGDTTNAIIYCDKSIKKDNNFTEPYVLKSQIKYENYSIKTAINLLEKVLAIDSNYVSVYYMLGIYHFSYSNYEFSINYLKKYKNKESIENKNSKLKKADYYISLSNFRIKALNNPIEFNPVKLPNTINTKENEYFPTTTADNNSLIFTRLTNGNNLSLQEDIFLSQNINNNFIKAINISASINTENNEGAHTFLTDGKTMIFTRCTAENGCDLYYAHLDKNGNWSNIMKLPYPINTGNWESQPCLSPDGSTLYFVSNREGGKGKMDIWSSIYLGENKWSKPHNLGDSINTEGNEMSPFIHFDNKSLYFSSDYHLGMGGFDLFYAKKNSDTSWTKPQNLGYPINTKKDELRLSIDNEGITAYFSKEVDTIYKQDIYSFSLPKQFRPTRTLYVKSRIFTLPEKQITKADKISLIDIITNDTIYSQNNISDFLICLPIGGKYALNISKENYMLFSESFSLENIDDSVSNYIIDVYLKPIVLGETFILKNTFFRTNSYNIDPISNVELDKLVEFLQQNPKVEILIAGHTDNIGSFEYNMELSNNRAKSIYEYLVLKGIKNYRITYQGFGFTKPIAENNSEKGRQLNRRTEIIIIKK
jgi:outer membrane protein OmpA-like peptidoglycan-associated protein